MSGIGKVTTTLGEVNQALATAALIAPALSALIGGVKAIIDRARGAGVDVVTFEEALARLDVGLATVEANAAEYDALRAQQREASEP